MVIVQSVPFVKKIQNPMYIFSGLEFLLNYHGHICFSVVNYTLTCTLTASASRSFYFIGR